MPLYNTDITRSKIITLTRDGTAATADVSYTGVGFVPTKLSAVSHVAGTLYNSTGYADSAKTGYCIFTSAADVVNNTAALIAYSNQSAWIQGANVKSYDADGFTLTWTKVGSPSAGTITAIVLCER